MKKLLLFVAIGVFASSCKNSKNSTTEQLNLSSEVDSVSYALGVNIGENFIEQFPEVNLDILNSGLIDALDTSKFALIAGQNCQNVIQSYFMKKQMEQQKEDESLKSSWLADTVISSDLITTESGLQYQILINGEGEKPTISDQVETHYHGTLLDGTVFDSSIERGQTAKFPVGGVIKGWTEALQLMTVGSKWKLIVPSELAYGENGAGQMIGPNTDLIFIVELISIN
jgi:FKBP-type peptidyl-prolyl cis-trans isomerase FklB